MKMDDKELRNEVVIYLHKIYDTAKIKCLQSRYDFDASKCKWVLGARICYLIMPYEFYNKKEEAQELFGIPVEIDFRNPGKIELWERLHDSTMDNCNM